MYIFLIYFILWVNVCFCASTYEVVDVKNLGGSYSPSLPLKINDRGNLVGFSYKNIPIPFFFDFEKKSLQYLEVLNDKYPAYITDINNDDLIIGFADDDTFISTSGRVRKSYPVIWNNFQIQNLSSTLGLGSIYQPSIYALSINDSEIVGGFGFDLNKKNADKRKSFVFNLNKSKQVASPTYSKSKKINLYTRLVSLNNNGDATGGVMYEDLPFFGIGHGFSAGPKAFSCVWDSKRKKLLKLGNLGLSEEFYSFALDLNDAFKVVGGSETSLYDSKGNYFWHAFLWENGHLLDLGTLESNEDSIAYAINNFGEVVGVSGLMVEHKVESDRRTKGFYWSAKTGLENLNSLIDSSLGWNIIMAKDINNSGQIAALASRLGEVHIVILNPRQK